MLYHLESEYKGKYVYMYREKAAGAIVLEGAFPISSKINYPMFAVFFFLLVFDEMKHESKSKKDILNLLQQPHHGT